MDLSQTRFPFADTDIAAALKNDFRSWLASRAEQPHGQRASRELNDASARVYQEMWFAFADYCAVHALDLHTLTTHQLDAFLMFRARGEGNARMLPKGSTLSPRYGWRMLTLNDRVSCFVAERDGRRRNHAAQEVLKRPEYRYANARQHDALPEYYTDTEVQRIIEHLNAASLPGDGILLNWKVMRDCTAIAVMLGAGLAPGDVRAAALSGVYVDGADAAADMLPWKMALPGNGNAPARETPIAPWAGRLLARWMTVRDEHDIPGDVLFPSTLSGKPLSHATCYKVCKAVLADIGLDSGDGGVFKLRHTFALRQLADGKSEEEVARWLGLLDIAGMARYRKIVKAPVDLI